MSESSTSVVSANLPMNTTEEQLKETFFRAGEIKSITLEMKPNGEFKGCAVIEFAYHDAASNAVRFNETQFRDQTITVEFLNDIHKKDRDCPNHQKLGHYHHNHRSSYDSSSDNYRDDFDYGKKFKKGKRHHCSHQYIGKYHWHHCKKINSTSSDEEELNEKNSLESDNSSELHVKESYSDSESYNLSSSDSDEKRFKRYEKKRGVRDWKRVKQLLKEVKKEIKSCIKGKMK